ncbi:MAG: aminopeptidase P N-terminal domain-containing protein [Gemmatimonadetes bacterium]|nr:aminopeptidase P N-terminal domain-containing protein [Gemmatimonadota bacterium]
MRHVVGLVVTVTLLGGAVPLRAQQAAGPAPYVEELPGAGRPIDFAATAARRQRLMDRLGDGIVLIPAARGRNLEQDYIQDNDFRQHNTFFYFTQLESPNAWLVMNARSAGPDTVVLLLPDRDPRQERWTGPKLGPGADAARLTGIPVVLSATKLDSVLGAAEARRVPTYAPLDRTTLQEAVVQRLRADTTRVVRDVRPVADSLRLVKDDAELAALRRAIAITTDAHREVMRGARPGMFEYELEALLEAAFRRRGADRVGFPSIVGSGFNATTLHYDVNRRQTRPGDLVVVDIGAEYGYHTADVTRTIPVGGAFTPRQRAIYDLVLATQQTAMDSVRPGMTVAQLNALARAYMREHSAGLCAPQTCDAYFIHGLSHWLGMDVHDVGDYRTPFAPGMVLTVEPGIYLPAESLGVRIEDDVLVTATGYELLSSGAPRAAQEIERLMQQPAEASVRRGQR